MRSNLRTAHSTSHFEAMLFAVVGFAVSDLRHFGDAHANWGWKPAYDLDRAFDEYLVPAVRTRYQP